jgi:hypothetical protein
MNAGLNARRATAQTRWIIRQHPWAHVTVLVLIPLIMAAINTNWLYSPIGYIDPWYNVGYFLHYGDSAFRNGLYKEARLSWILPGWILYHIFPPLAANFVLHVGSLLIATLALYFALARLIAPEFAFLSAVILTVYFPFHGSGGWDYQSTGSGMFYALAVLSLAAAAQSQRPKRPLFAAGAAIAAALHANVLFINMIPVLAGQYLVVRAASLHRPTRNDALRAALWILSGAVVLTLILCLVNCSVGRQFPFFRPIVDIVFRYVKDPDHQKAWWLPWDKGWMFSYAGYYLGLLFATLIVGAWVLSKTALRGAYKDAQIQCFLIGQYVFLAALWIVWQSLGQTALQPDYFAYPLIIPCIMALGGLMSLSGSGLSVSFKRWIVPGCLLFAFIPGLDMLGRLVPGSALASIGDPRWVIPFYFLSLVLVLATTRTAKWPILPFLMIAVLQIYYPLFTRAGYVAGDKCSLSSTGYEAFMKLDRLATSVGGQDKSWMWLGPPETAKDAVGCVVPVAFLRTSAQSVAFNRLGTMEDKSASDIPAQEIAAIPKDSWIAAVSTSPATAESLAERLRQAGRSVGSFVQSTATVAHSVLYLTMFRVTQ